MQRAAVTRPLAGLLALAAAGAGDAAASGYFLREQSAVAQGTSHAGAQARGDDPSMLFYNPAAMAWLEGAQTASVGSGIFPQASLRDGTATRNPLLGGTTIFGSQGGDAGLDAFVPALYGSVGMGHGVHLGFGVNAPFGLVTKYPNDYIGRYHALTSSLRTTTISPAIAWRPIPSLAVGAALNIQTANAKLSQAIDFGAVGALSGLGRFGLRPGSADGRGTVRGSDLQVGWQVGVQWRPLDGTQLGLSYRSAITHDLQGEATFEGVPALFGLSPALSRQFANTLAQAKFTTPESAALGATQRIGQRWTVLGTAEWTNWSRFRELLIEFDSGRPPTVTPQRWRDTAFLALGAEYAVSPDLTLRAGAAWDQTPVRDETRTPRIPDSDRYWLSIGGSYQALRHTTLSLAYTHIFADEGTLRLRDTGPPGSTEFLRGNLSGTYRASVDIVAVQARMTF